MTTFKITNTLNLGQLLVAVPNLSVKDYGAKT